MNKKKLLTPLLSVSVATGIVLPMASCACKNSDSFVKESIYFEKEQTINTYATYILVLDKDTYTKDDIKLQLIGEGSDQFIVEHFISNNMLIIQVTPTEFPDEGQTTYQFNLEVNSGNQSKEFSNLIINVLPEPEVPTVNEHLLYRYHEDTNSYYAYCDLTDDEAKAKWDVKTLYLLDEYNDGQHGILPVTGIEDSGFENCTTIKKLIIPETITYIGELSFCSYEYIEGVSKTCTGQIKKIKFLGTPQLKSIGYGAFSGQSQLKSIDIPDSVDTIGDSAFDCINAAYDNNYRGSYVINYNSVGSLGNVIFGKASQLKTISEGAFRGQKNISNFDLPNNVQELGNEAFACYDYEYSKQENTYFYTPTGNISNFNIDIDNSNLQLIGRNAFEGQKEMTSINIPEYCHKIGSSGRSISNPFVLCQKLEKFNIHASNNFVKTNEQKNILFASINTETVGDMAFVCYPTAKGDVDLSSYDDSVRICNYAFQHNSDITSIKANNANTKIIGNYAFSDCKNLKTIEFGKSLERTAQDSFYYSKNLSDFKIDSENPNFSSIGEGSNKPILMEGSEISCYPSAKGDIDLTSSFYDGITGLGYCCFDTTEITSFKANSNTIKIDDPFNECNKLESVDINMVNNITSGTLDLCPLKQIYANESNTGYQTLNDNTMLVQKNLSTLELYLNGSGKDLDFSSGVLKNIQRIGATVFRCFTLSPINIQSLGSVTWIDRFIFWNRTLENKNITIPATTTYIGWCTFLNTKGLETITFEDPTGWKYKGETIDVSDPAANAQKMISGEWGELGYAITKG